MRETLFYRFLISSPRGNVWGTVLHAFRLLLSLINYVGIIHLTLSGELLGRVYTYSIVKTSLLVCVTLVSFIPNQSCFCPETRLNTYYYCILDSIDVKPAIDPVQTATPHTYVIYCIS